MDREGFDRAVYEKWANRFDCTVKDLSRPGTELMPDETFAGTSAVHIWRIGQRAFARLDPEVLTTVRTAVERLPATSSLDIDHLEAAMGPNRIRKIEESLLHYLYPPDFDPFPSPPMVDLRQITSGDADALAEMKAACTPEEVEMGEVSVEDEIGFGCFVGETLAAIATGFRLTGFMDIGVLTHPDYRRQGLGKAAVSALCDWCIEHDVIAQYRCLTTNTGSHAIARALHFHRYFGQQSVYLTTES